MQKVTFSFKRIDWLVVSIFVLYSLVLLGLAISGWNWYDVQWFIKWTHYDLLHVYNAPKCAYFPLTPILFVLLYKSAVWIAKTFALSHPIYFIRFIVKLPLIVAAVATAVILYRRGDAVPLVAWIASAAVYSNIWSLQFDLIVGLLLLLSCLTLTRRPSLAAVLVGLATLFKQAAAICILPHIIVLKLRKSARDIIVYTFTFLAVVLSAVLPYLLVDYASFMQKAILFHAHRMPQDLSIWNVPQILTRFTVKIPVLSWLWEIPFVVSTLLLTTLFLAKGRKVVRELSDVDLTLALTSLFLLVLLFWNKVGNPGYILWALPLLLLLFRENLLYAALVDIATLFADFLYPWILCVPAAVLGKKVFIIEDWKYWPARSLLTNSTIGLPVPLQLYIVLPILPGEGKIMALIEKNFPLLATICIAIYNAFLLVSMVMIAKRLKRKPY